MAEGEGSSEDFKQQAVKLKGKPKLLTQLGYGSSVSPGRSTSLLPIAELSPGQTIFNWGIRGLVARKSEIKPYSNGHGIYFSFEMRDEAGGEIRVVCFQSEVTRFFEKVVEGKEHVLTRGKLMKPKERFNRMNRRCEIVLEYDSEIRVLEEEEEEENNKSLLERVTEINEALEFCTSKLQDLETEIKKGGKTGNLGAASAGTASTVKMEAAPGVVVVGASENRAQGTVTTRGAGLGALNGVSPIKFSPFKFSLLKPVRK